jgi:hypothetical protein
MGAVIAVTTRVMELRIGVSQLARLADLAVSIPIGLAVFYVGCRLLGVSELDMAIRAFAAPIRRRLLRRG